MDKEFFNKLRSFLSNCDLRHAAWCEIGITTFKDDNCSCGYRQLQDLLADAEIRVKKEQ
jgi:hypothetical protein